MWEPRRLTTLWAFTARYKYSFILTLWACTPPKIPSPNIIEVTHYSDTFIAAFPRRMPGRHLEIGHDHLLSTQTLDQLDIREVASSNIGNNGPGPAIPTDGFHGCAQSLQVNVGTVPRIMP
jgi:hypothetical protein